jgi:hypothetical protein
VNLSPATKLKILGLRNRILGICPSLARRGETLQLLRHERRWRNEGWIGSPPYLVKRAMLLAECRRIGTRWFVETGTYMGDTLWFLREAVPNLVSIEVQPELARLAARRFRKFPRVDVVNGDSALELAAVVKRVDGPCLFWLDGHYSAGMTGRGVKDCPIFEEIAAIAGLADHEFSIMIDDARCFGTDPAYPGVGQLRESTDKLFPRHQFNIWNDVIHILAGSPARLDAEVDRTHR